jgi:type IV pilus assembly protein PilC
MDNIKKGLGIAEPLKELGIFPPMLISMIRIGEESGSLDSMLAKTADFYDEEVESAVAKMTTLIEPLIIVILAFVVGAIVVSIVLPMFEMFNQIGV